MIRKAYKIENIFFLSRDQQSVMNVTVLWKLVNMNPICINIYIPYFLLHTYNTVCSAQKQNLPTNKATKFLKKKKNWCYNLSKYWEYLFYTLDHWNFYKLTFITL